MQDGVPGSSQAAAAVAAAMGDALWTRTDKSGTIRVHH